MNVAEIFEGMSHTQKIFKQFGFGALLNPVLRKTFGRITSIEKACRLHRVDLDAFLQALNSAEESSAEAIRPPSVGSKTFLVDNISASEMVSINNILATNIRDLTEAWPQTKEVFIGHFGAGCFSCPAFGTESVQFACSMHNSDPIAFARDCLKIIKQIQSEKKGGR